MDRSRGRPPPEVDLGVAVVRRLLAAQFPQWTDLPLRHVQSAGWDNEIFRLGGELAVRLPRRAMGAEQVGRLLRWLPAVASNLTLPIPVPLSCWPSVPCSVEQGHPRRSPNKTTDGRKRNAIHYKGSQPAFATCWTAINAKPALSIALVSLAVRSEGASLSARET